MEIEDNGLNNDSFNSASTLTQEELSALNEFSDKVEFENEVFLEGLNEPEKICGNCNLYTRCGRLKLLNDYLTKKNVINGTVGTDDAFPLKDESWSCGDFIPKVETVEFTS